MAVTELPFTPPVSVAARAGLVVAALSLLLAALGAWAVPARAATEATGTIAVVDAPTNKYSLTVQNTGDTTIACVRFTAPEGVKLVDVANPGTTVDGRVLTGSGLVVSPPNVITYVFLTEQPYPQDGGGVLEVSSTCTGSYEGVVNAIGPSPAVAPPPPPGPPLNLPPPGTDGDGLGTLPPLGTVPCECNGLRASYESVRREGRVVTLNLKAILRCTLGAGGCSGRIGVVSSPAASAVDVRTGSKTERFARSKSAVIRCTTEKCTERKTVRSRVRLTLSKARSSRLRKQRTLRVRLRSSCLGGLAARQTQLITMTLVFDSKGRFSRDASDMNGDRGRDDGRSGRVGRGSA